MANRHRPPQLDELSLRNDILYSPLVSPGAKKLVVLVVEDEPGLRELYRSALSIAGYAVVAVEDGIAALRLIDLGTAPHAVVLDMALPRLSGYDVQRELHAHDETSDIPIVVVTGADTLINENEFACVLRKPITPEALVEAVRNCLRRAS